MAKIGITTAVIEKPRTTIHQSNPDLTPREGGKIRLPAPKNSEKRAKPVIQNSLVLFISTRFKSPKYTYFCRMDKELEFRNASIAYRLEGKGNCVVLLHGFLENLNSFSNLTNVLSTRHKVISIDLPGHGKSDCLGYIHTMDEMAEAVLQVLKKERIRRCFLIGHSMGGYVSLAFAEKYPKFIRGLCLLNSTSVEDSKRRKEFRDLAIRTAKRSYEKVVRISVRNLFSEENQIKLKPEVEKTIAAAVQTPLQGYIAAQEGMKLRPNREHVLQSSTFKKLQITGNNDEVIPLKDAKKESARTKTDLIVLDGGHMSFIENNGEIEKTLKAFVK